MADFRKITRSTAAREQFDSTSPVIFNLEPGQIVEVLSEEHPVYVRARHLAQAVYILREDTVQALPEEVTLIQPASEMASAVAAPAPGPTMRAAPIASSYCPHCGATMERGARFCRECGRSLLAASGRPGELVGFWFRFGAYIIDYILVAAIFAIPPSFLTADSAFSSALIFVFALLLPVAYYVIGYGIGRTIGCLALGLRIETDSGGEPGLGRGFVRWFISIFSALAFGLGYLWAIWDPKKQTWHDKAAGTIVLKR